VLNHLSWHELQAARVIRRGGIIAYPTEGVYGLGCDPTNPVAIARILELKHRGWSKGLIVIAAYLDQLRKFADLSDRDIEQRLAEPTLEPITWIVPALAGLPRSLTGGRTTVAVRLIAHELTRALCERVGPLVSTSANPSGVRPARDAFTVRRYFGAEVELIVPGYTGGGAGPSEIRDARTDAVLRPAAR
jgi:L-threonylcarbamoyladenylate synthase